MWVLGTVVSLVLILVVLVDGFEAMLLPRRVNHRRLARLFYRSTWAVWRAAGCRMKPGKRRETFLSVFGPLSLLGLFITWIVVLLLAFALLHCSLGTLAHVAGKGPAEDFWGYWYFSGVTFFTLGYGDLVPTGALGRFLAVAEAGLGLGFLAVIIGYMPVLYQAFSRREVTISLMDARAGSPPTAAQALLRLAQAHEGSTDAMLAEWERWSAELLESHISFPVMSYYRSQHDNQSWLAALTVMLDTSALLIVGVKKSCNQHQARLTFAMARHAAVDLALVFDTRPVPPEPDRLPPEQFASLYEGLGQAGFELAERELFARLLAEMRTLYEPFVNALAGTFLLTLPPILPVNPRADNWQTSAWTPRAPAIGGLPTAAAGDHFD
jgi:hypothetical protein